MLTFLATAALAVTACGSADSASSSTTPAQAAAAAAAAATVKLATAAGIGNILVDNVGRTLYTPDEEKTGTIVCLDPCSTIWVPLKPGVTAPTVAIGGPTLAVIDRPDGTRQITVGGRPLYTLASEVPGKVTGQNVSDAFGTQHLTWHVMLANGTTSSLPAPISTTSPYGEGGY
jgi:predicted lipoprotein with Yx(FWY)xxD motif